MIYSMTSITNPKEWISGVVKVTRVVFRNLFHEYYIGLLLLMSEMNIEKIGVYSACQVVNNTKNVVNPCLENLSSVSIIAINCEQICFQTGFGRFVGPSSLQSFSSSSSWPLSPIGRSISTPESCLTPSGPPPWAGPWWPSRPYRSRCGPSS